jgi:diguanylate cyclase (GGDEF)-like protein/PAS domain S-box-containing protein
VGQVDRPAADEITVPSGRISVEVVERVVNAALARYPDASVAAIAPDGWIVALPDRFPVGEHPVLAGETALELVVAGDRAALVAAWARARAAGAAHVQVRLAGDGRPAIFQFADLRERYDVFVLLVLDGGSVPPELLDGEGGQLRPRYCQMRRSELAYVIEADEAASAMFGWPADVMIGRKSIEFVHPDDQSRAIDNWLEMLGAPGRVSRWRGRYLNADETWSWVETTNHNRLQDPAHEDVLTEMVNIDDEMSMHEELRSREELIRQLTQAMPVGVIQVDQTGRIVFTNPRVDEILGLTHAPSVQSLRPRIVPDDVARFDEAIVGVLVRGEDHDLEVRLLARDGAPGRVCQVNARPLRDAAGEVTGAVACVTDVTDSAQLRYQLEERATFDGLTGCHNRSSTIRQLDHLIATRGHVGVVFIDLDDFKPVNDRYGHSAGDQLLTIVADRLRSCVRTGDVLGRMGGDEFVVLQPGVADGEVLAKLAGRLHRVLHADAALDRGVVTVRASVGGVIAHPGDDAGRVLAEADSAMYEAKRSHLGRPVLVAS